MANESRWQKRLALLMVLISVFLYWVHFLLFHDAHLIQEHLILELAFLPIHILFVVLVVDQLLARREKLSRLQKMNMVIGTFFGEVGTPLLRMLSPLVTDPTVLRELNQVKKWSDEEFAASRARVAAADLSFHLDGEQLQRLKDFVLDKRDFLLRLLENPVLLEHETFTDVLWAIFHIIEELRFRQSLHDLRPGDRQHLDTDVTRAYAPLLTEWLHYMQHLRQRYPFLFSLEMRTNPFDPDARVEVE
ncbi:MAG: hypothetical protein QHH05_02070 [Syntrophomonadaceae bacterium]|nr:hypothetical protein [Syntrophomonadaceae bacterium]